MVIDKKIFFLLTKGLMGGFFGLEKPAKNKTRFSKLHRIALVFKEV